ncbi:MAG: PaaR repeat-containing protein [Crocinitomix sp.]|nr:PaaR repeat-containing protein [Crocinitomix sp.]
MAAGAKVGDITNHGGTITGPGVPTVLLEGMPASVALDMHACVLPPPHVPVSAFPIGSMTVLIGGKPALRVGDTCICGASAIIGAPTILIG